MKPQKLLRQVEGQTSLQLPDDVPTVDVQFVTAEGDVQEMQPKLVMEFDGSTGDIAHAGAAAPTAAEFNALVDDHNKLIKCMEEAGILQRP